MYNIYNTFFFYFKDVNECTKLISGCNQECTNTNGSYKCSCYSGYRLRVDQKICEGERIILQQPCFKMFLFHLCQTLMSAIWIMEDVTIPVLTLMEAINAHVRMDMTWTMTNISAMVFED